MLQDSGMNSDVVSMVTCHDQAGAAAGVEMTAEMCRQRAVTKHAVSAAQRTLMSLT